MYSVLPFRGVVKKLVIINVVIWIVLQLIVGGFFNIPINSFFGLSTYNVFTNFLVFEPFTYMFLHGSSPFHILFNMLMLWFFGTELERIWGRPFFLLYYIVCGVGSGLVYLLVKTIIFLVMGRDPVDMVTVVGSSGAIFGLMLAYGILFSERTVYFMMMFPMKVKWMVTIIGGISFIALLQSGIDGSGVSNLSHLGGILIGYLFLVIWTKMANRRS